MVNLTSKSPDAQQDTACSQSCNVNVNDAERAVSTIAGGMLLMYAMSRFSLTTLMLSLAGGAMIYRGYSGHCHLYEAAGTSSLDVQDLESAAQSKVSCDS